MYVRIYYKEIILSMKFTRNLLSTFLQIWTNLYRCIWSPEL